ncbi:MAG: amino acid adenylation domain-containing protein, partial [Chloroflexi bacterium]
MAANEGPVNADIEVDERRRELLARRLAGAAAGGPPALDRAPRQGDLPMSHAQERMWFLHRLDPDSDEYNIAACLRLSGALDAAALAAALGDVVARHEVLRTTLELRDGRPVQVPGPPGPVPLVPVDLRGLPAAGRGAEVERRVREEVARPFDLARGPLLRALLLRAGESEHVLALTLHHAVFDGWSEAVLTRELAALYRAHLRSEPSPLPPLAMQYADVARWQRRRLESGVLEDQLRYWRGRLEGASGLELPADRSRPAVRTPNGGLHRLDLGPDLTGRLRALCQETRCSLFMGLLAVFDLLLARYSGQDDVVVGTVVAGRDRVEAEALIGCFVNTLVLRTDLGGDPDLRTVLGRVRETVLGAFAHQDVPFERLVEDLGPERDTSRMPLFQVLFSLDNAPTGEFEMEGLRVEPYPFAHHPARFDLALFATDSPSGLEVRFLYSRDLFEPETIARMAGQLELLLAAAVAEPGRPVSELEPLTRAERSLLAAWNDTGGPYPDRRCLHELIEEQVERTPGAVAVAMDGRQLTYRRLNRAANRVAEQLRALGVGPETRVALSMEPCPELVVALLGVLKAGGAYVPLDPAQPRGRLERMVETAGARVRLDGPGSTRPAPGLPALEADSSPLGGDENPCSGVVPDNLAYVLYTSGSTGAPKGVAVPHRGLVNYLAWACREYGAGGPIDAPVHSSLTFDLTVTSLFCPLLTGGRVELVPGIDGLVQALRERPGYGLVKITPAHLARLTHELGEAAGDARVRSVVAGGDFLAGENARWWRDHAPATELVNEYGPTETVVGCSIHRVPADQAPEGSVGIGRPMPNTTMRVLDRRLRPVPAGAAGELCIGGACVVRGYEGAPGLTAASFVPDPLGPPGSRLYRSGDLARHLPDGSLACLGRIDHQIKVRGYRIEPGEVETALREHSAVDGAAVVAREDAPGQRRLVAYVTGEGADGAELLRHLAARLPGYMVPSAVVALPELPLTPNGKLDRNALPAPEWTAGAPYAAPRTAREQALAGIWSGVLRRQRVGLDDDFFESGGDSLLAIQVASRAAEAGLAFSIRQLFQLRTVRALAAEVGEGGGAAAEQGPVQGPVPLTPVQRWFFERPPGHPSHFNQAVRLAVPRRLGPEVVQAALAALVDHHDALRMRWRRRGAEWRQENQPPGAPPRLRTTGGRGLAEAEVAAELHGGLDLEAGRLVGAALLDGGDGPRRLLLVAHHLVVDAVSWRILLEDLERACRQLAAGEPVDLGRKTSSFQEWSLRLVDHAASEAVAAEAPFWTGVVAGGSAPLPRDHARGANTVGSEATVEVALDEAETARVLGGLAAPGAGADAPLLAALAGALGEWAGGRLLVDVEGHGREDLFADVDLSRTVGWFTTLRPLAVPAGPAATPERMAAALAEPPARGIGYGLLRYLGPDVGLAARLRHGAEVSFNHLGRWDTSADPDGLLRPLPGHPGPDRHPDDEREHVLDAVGGLHDGRLQLVLAYSSDLHRRETIERLAERCRERLLAP